MKIEFIKEGLDSNFDFVTQSQKLSNTADNVRDHNKAKGLQKIIKFNKQNVQGEQMKAVMAGIEEWDEHGLTKNISSLLVNRILQKGWDKNDVFIQWLIKTDNNNIKALDIQSATALIKHLDEKHFKPNNEFITDENNGLFSESSKDIIYKLNALYMISDPRTAKKYKNDKGEHPKLNLIYNEDTKKFFPASQMKKNLDNFSSEDNNDDLIPFKEWVSKIANWKPEEVSQNIKNIVAYIYRKDENVKNQWLQQIKFLFSEAGKKEMVNLYNNCEIDKNIKPDQKKEIWEAILNYFQDEANYIKNSTVEENNLPPNTVLTVSKALELSGLTPESGYKKLSLSLQSGITDTKERSNLISNFNKIYNSDRLRSDFFNSKIKTNSKGELPWAQHIRNYIISIVPEATEKDKSKNALIY